MSDTAPVTPSAPASTPSAATIEHGGFTITSSDTTPEAMKESLAKSKGVEPESAEEEPEKKETTASEAGKKGAAAKKAIERYKARQARQEPAEESEPKEAASAAPDADGEAGEPSEEPAEEKGKTGKPRHDPKARMLEATREAAQLKRELAEIRAENQRIRQEMASARAPQRSEAQPDEDPDPEPKAEDYPEYDQWRNDYTKWAARRAAEEAVERAEQERGQRESAQKWGRAITAHVQKYVESLGESPEEVKEFVAGLHPDVQGLQPSFLLGADQQPGPLNVVADEITRSENARPLLLLFSEFPQELQRLATLRTPHEVVREMAKLEARLEAAMAGASAPERVPSQAPTPPRPVRGGAPVAAGGKYRPGMSLDEYAQGWKPAAQR